MKQDQSAECAVSRERHHNVLFGIRRSVRYHDHRRRFYLNLRAWINFFTIIAGSATVASAVAASGSQLVQWLAGACVAVLAAFDLAVGTADKATLHTDLYRRFIRLERRLLNSREESAEALTSIESEQLDIEMDEPPIYHALNRLCHNELLRSEGRPELFETLSWPYRTLRNVVHFPNLPATKRKTVSTGAANQGTS